MATEKNETKEKLTEKQIEAKIVELAKTGLTSEKIGLVLKNEFNVPKAKANGKKVSVVLKENNLYQDTDVVNLQKTVDQLKAHVEKHIHDFKTKRTLLITEARLKKLKEYRAE